MTLGHAGPVFFFLNRPDAKSEVHPNSDPHPVASASTVGVCKCLARVSSVMMELHRLLDRSAPLGEIVALLPKYNEQS